MSAAVAVEPADRMARVRQLNDALRQSGQGGRTMVTAGVAALPDTTRNAVLAAVRTFAALGPDNDPHGEHDCALLTVAGQRILWKVDCYDRDLQGHSPDPADPAVTARVLTVMLAEEY